MKINHITLFISSAVLMATLWIRQAVFTGSSAYERYYVTAILMISGILTLITLCRMIRYYRNPPITIDDTNRRTTERPRQHYRMQFDESSGPVFIQKTDDRLPAAAFSCPVCDISETGIGLVCSEVYARGETVQGKVIFGSGRTAPVNGVVVREAGGRTCLRLHCTIDPPLLMAEQREQIVMQKASGPRPAVSETVLDTTAESLPSHSPKGICRIK